MRIAAALLTLAMATTALAGTWSGTDSGGWSLYDRHGAYFDFYGMSNHVVDDDGNAWSEMIVIEGAQLLDQHWVRLQETSSEWWTTNGVETERGLHLVGTIEPKMGGDVVPFDFVQPVTMRTLLTTGTVPAIQGWGTTGTVTIGPVEFTLQPSWYARATYDPDGEMPVQSVPEPSALSLVVIALVVVVLVAIGPVRRR